MARPKLRPGTYGNIYAVENKNGSYTAKARFRDIDGKTRLVERTASTKAKATDLLKEHFLDRAAPYASTELTGNSDISHLAKQWWQSFLELDRAIQTVRLYRETLDLYILPRMGDLTLSEATVGVLSYNLRGIAKDNGYASAKRSKSVLSNMFKFAAARDAVKRNPMPDVQLPAAPKTLVKALTFDEAVRLRAALTDDNKAVLSVLLGTGCRIGEALALRWGDIDLTPGRSQISINGTLVHDDKGKLIRQPHPKSNGSNHVVFIPDYVAEMLRDRAQNHIPAYATSTAWAEAEAYVFPSTAGTALDPNNFRSRWRRQVKAAGFEGVKPHTIRKTVATYLAQAESITSASLQLGHSGENVTMRHYVDFQQLAPDMSGLLEAFGNPNYEENASA